ncbi:Helitron helicase [Phytophthora megakarya]|uniref:ATP-dependent DNA helicase n=1 Tax=Phytophthora megakarya TaxID=4795 RepID=A0A225UWK0_9STRA|nr:Helitron helicase [Phytophthora megakarya]
MISNLQTIPANNQFIVVQSIWHSEIYMNIYSQTGKIWKCTLIRSLNFLNASDVAYRERNRFLEAETSYNHDELAASVDTLHQLNADQKAVFDNLRKTYSPSHKQITDNSQWEMFLDGPGGTGKSFLLEKILAYVRQKGSVALALAGSEIAAQLLTGGKTAHSAFNLSLDHHETSTCNIGSRSFDAALLKRTNVIVWDEAPMTHQFQYEALDLTLQDLMKNNMPFGGITMLLCGDFRQTLPVIQRAGPAEVISSTIKRSDLWRYFEWLRLSINMRVQTSRNPQTAAEVGASFADYLLQVGDGRHFISPTLGPDFIKVPEDMLLDICSLPQSNIEE